MGQPGEHIEQIVQVFYHSCASESIVTHGGIEWVVGSLWWKFRTATVVTTLQEELDQVLKI